MRHATGPPLDVPPWTVPDALVRAAREHGEKPAFLSRGAPGGPFLAASWRDVVARMERLAAGLLSAGLRPGERVAIVSETRAEWALADGAVMMAGGVVAAVFPTLPEAQALELLTDSGARFAFVEDAAQWAKARGATIERAFAFEPAPDDDKRVSTLSALEDEGARLLRADPEAVARRRAQLRPEHVATIVYTSGTTGRAKGVLLTHRNLVASAAASIARLRFAPHPVGLAFLPLAHSYQRQSAIVLILLAGSVAFTSPARLADDLRAVRPTLLPAVPRLYERMHERIHETVHAMPRHRQLVFAAAERAAIEHGRAVEAGGRAGATLRARRALFEALVYRRLRRMAGLDRLELAVTGAAAMRPDLLRFFRGIGVRIVEGWGLSETTAPATVNLPDRFKAGTVGPPLPGVDVALDDDGEVLVRGPVVFQGYHGMEAETREAFVEREGARWFRTGDLGELDADGFLRIVDRKKDLEVLDTGKKVAPMPIEEALKATPFVEEALVTATGRKLVGALLQPRYGVLLAWARQAGVAFDASRIRRGPGPSGEEVVTAVDPALLADARVLALFERALDEVNATRPPHERVRAYRLVPEAFRAERGDLTPTLKKRRAAILARHASLVDDMFREPRPPK